MDFKREFRELVIEKKIDWNIRGLLSSDDRIYPFGSDTKVLSTVFELFCSPLIKEIATRHGYMFETSPQTIYPDFTLLKNKEDKKKIAVDVKTTYRRGLKKDGTEKNFVYTLGSYTSYIRNNTKNILYSYDQYEKHWIIGFLYSRNTGAYDDSEIYKIEERTKIQKPFVDVEFFVQEKYKIAGKRPGSGNTTNIASFSTNNIEDLEEGKGPFTKLGEEAFLDYWKKYKKS
jgi:Restriction endonuclease EcoRV